MPLKLTVDKLEDVPEALRENYQEKDGKFILAVDGLEDNAAAQKTIENLRRVERERTAEIEKTRKEIATWKKFGKSQEDIEKALSRLDELEEKNLENKGDFETLKAQLVEKTQEQLKKSEKRAADAEAKATQIEREREQERLESVLKDAIAAGKGKLRALMPIVKQFVEIRREDGAIKYVVIDDNKEPRRNLEGPRAGEPMTIAELIADLADQEEYAGNFVGTGNSGGGARQGAGGKQPPHGIRSHKDFGIGPDAARKIEQFFKSYPTVEEAQKAFDALPSS